MQRRHLLAAGLALGAAAGGARAQATPIRILVGAPAGGSTDTLARSLANELGRLLGRTVVVENRPGAGGNIAADLVAKSAPDGNTILMSFTSHAINASLYPQPAVRSHQGLHAADLRGHPRLRSWWRTPRCRPRTCAN